MNDISRKEDFDGSVPLNLDFMVIERNKAIDQQGRATMDVRVQFTADSEEPDHPVYSVGETLSLDSSIIDEASEKTYPRTATELLAKITPSMLQTQEETVTGLAEEQSKTVRRHSVRRSRAAASAGAFAGASLMIGVTEITQDNYSGAIVAGFLGLMGGVVMVGAASKHYPEAADELKVSAELDRERSRLVILKLIQSAVQKNRVQNTKILKKDQHLVEK